MGPSTPFRPALIVVDLQEDFCPPNGSLAVPNGRDIIQTVNSLLDLPFVIKICTKDWHPTDHISFASNHPGKEPFIHETTITHPADPTKSYNTRLWPIHCVQNTPGAEIVLELNLSKVDVVIEKGMRRETEMYSAFCDPFAWQVSELQDKLEEKEVSDVFVVGLAGDYCVLETARDAARQRWKGNVWVVDEGVRCVDQSVWGQVTDELGKTGVHVVKFEGEEVGKVRNLGK